MILNLGLDSGFGGLEAIYTALADEYLMVKNNRKVFLGIIHLVLFLCSLPTITYGGIYVVTFLEFYSTSPALMLVVFFEAISVCWVYGSKKFCGNIFEMCKVVPNKYWLMCWKYAIPLIIFVLFIHNTLFMEEPVVDKYIYPKTIIVLGWAINISMFLPIPIFALYQFIQKKILK
jgi:SNF family Na+-dependent transporter